MKKHNVDGSTLKQPLTLSKEQLRNLNTTDLTLAKGGNEPISHADDQNGNGNNCTCSK